tara:strand:+ start:926 stop:1261 length:336 start_codon:yes stop_codon:yes gene_type:complete
VKAVVKKEVISTDVKMADTLISRMVGLLSSKKLDSGESLLITPCNSIHTFFMRFNIDVLFLDKDDIVVKIFRDLPPWRLTRPYFSVQSVLEGAANSFCHVNIGDKVEYTDV